MTRDLVHIPIPSVVWAVENLGLVNAINKGPDKKLPGGIIIHSACPQCGGQDRFECYGGTCRCRKCGYAFNIANYLHGNGKNTGAPKYTAKDLERMRREEERKTRERIRKVRKYLNSGVMNRLNAAFFACEKAQDFAWRQWGFDADIARKYLLGYDPNFKVYDWEQSRFVVAPAIVFPHRVGSYIYAATARVMNPPPTVSKYRPWRKMGRAFVYVILNRNPALLVVEGAAKAITIYEALEGKVDLMAVSGVNQLSGRKGENTVRWTKQRYSRVVVLFDGDNEKVNKAAYDTAKRLGGKAMKPFGKPDDMLRSGKISPAWLLDQITNL